MQKWLDTTIAGFTSEPMVLSSYFSQSYRPGHHNFSEGFLFEPRADPNVTLEQLAELEEIDLLRIYWSWGSFYSMDNNSCTDDNNTDCCGNGIIDDDEECDNGENEYGSGCDWDCTVEMVVCEDDGPTTTAAVTV